MKLAAGQAASVSGDTAANVATSVRLVDLAATRATHPMLADHRDDLGPWVRG